MWIRFLTNIGLTNLSDEQVDEYYIRKFDSFVPFRKTTLPFIKTKKYGEIIYILFLILIFAAAILIAMNAKKNLIIVNIGSLILFSLSTYMMYELFKIKSEPSYEDLFNYTYSRINRSKNFAEIANYSNKFEPLITNIQDEKTEIIFVGTSIYYLRLYFPTLTELLTLKNEEGVILKFVLNPIYSFTNDMSEKQDDTFGYDTIDYLLYLGIPKANIKIVKYRIANSGILTSSKVFINTERYHQNDPEPLYFRINRENELYNSYKIYFRKFFQVSSYQKVY